MSTSVNRWLIGPNPSEEPECSTPVPTRRDEGHGATAPQTGIPLPDRIDRLPRRDAAWPATIWWLGVHGGAGESTLAALTAGTRPCDHAWPIPSTTGTTHRVVLVARTNYAGLIKAQHAATEWAANTLGDGVQLAGLALIADAPGRRPKHLQHLEQVIAGGVPHVWNLPWVNAWRLGPPDATAPLPKEFRALFTDLSLAPTGAPTHN
ncbi:DUF6668 family protein [Cryobacterium sp. M91]|uniref:DUF6668 family protein n=1 Tax=Cryobacterium sp. M91 TaxID=2048294 RepID=UPI000CE44254|nr:DUF6668 family protein [Cryobacterium sp. M91]